MILQELCGVANAFFASQNALSNKVRKPVHNQSVHGFPKLTFQASAEARKGAYTSMTLAKWMASLSHNF